MTVRSVVPRPVAEGRVVAVLRAPRATDWSPIIEVLLQHGIAGIELTLTTPAALDDVATLAQRFGDSASIGVGTVTTAGQAIAAIDAGAEFLVTPGVVPGALEAAVAHDVPIVGGALTPSEVMTTWQSGAAAVKIFPASVVGPGYVRELRGPFPDLAVMPSGGVGIDDVEPWLRAGAAAVSLGGALIGDAINGDVAGLRERCERVQRHVAAAAER